MAPVLASHSSGTRQYRTRSSHAGFRAHLRRSGSGHQSGSSMVGRLPEGEFPSDYVPLLRWLIFTGVTLFGFVLAWHFGLIRLMLASDPTHISAVICALYVVVTLHCLAQTVAVSRELNSGHRAFA